MRTGHVILSAFTSASRWRRHQRDSLSCPSAPPLASPTPAALLNRRSARLSRTSSAPSYISLFSGCGGLDLGFLRAGYNCLHAYDFDSASVATYNYNLGPSRATVADLSGGFLNSLPVQPDVVIAGPPCQGFSTIGRRDLNDVRNHLLLKPVEFAVNAKAKVLLLENVRGALSGRHARYWNEAIRLLGESGYTTATLQIAAAMAGLPQIRRRIVLVASRRGFNPPEWTRLNSVQSLDSVLDVPSDSTNHRPRPLDPQSRAGLIARRIAPGQKLSNVRAGPRSVHTWDIPDVYGPVSQPERQLLEGMLILRRRCRVRSYGDADPVPYPTLRDHFGGSTHIVLDALIRKDYVRLCGSDKYDLRRTFNGKFHRLHPNRPAYSVLTKFCDPSHFLYPRAQRGFTIREAARLQGFPDDFRFLGSPQQQAVQVGNAVPVPLALLLARWIRATLL